ncbi:MAG: hypothetical protein GXO29_03745 [Thermotogae bacterium]|nr:hypothetical protein [Thermotogota bacterium]
MKRILLILGFVAVVVFTFMAIHYVPYALAAFLFLVGVLWGMKAYGDLGLDNVRGQFYAIMALALIFQGIGFLFTSVGESIELPTGGLAFYLLARFLFFAATVRYIAYFQSRGYRLNLQRAALVLLFTLFLVVSIFIVPNAWDTFRSLSPYTLFILFDAGIAFIVFYNILLLWGSETAKKWIVGSLAIAIYLFADALFISKVAPLYPLSLWALASFLMGFIATVRG